MCCIFAMLLLLGPRISGAIWWIARPNLWATAFSSWIWPLLGLVFLPWTTLMYLLVFPAGVNGLEWVLIVFSVIADLASYAGSAYGNRDRIPGYNPSATNI